MTTLPIFRSPPDVPSDECLDAVELHTYNLVPGRGQVLGSAAPGMHVQRDTVELRTSRYVPGTRM